MPESTRLPDLPLMLAGVPAPVAELLRASGLPVAPLPRVMLLAAGCGRFVLFDLSHSRSAGQARRAARQGLTIIDLRELCLPEEWPAGDDSSLLKNGGWLRSHARIPGSFRCREVPVPVFQQPDRARSAAAGGTTHGNPGLSRAFLERLKLEIERRGGVWLRVADFPFPYQSAMSVVIEHVSDELPELAELAAEIGRRATHMVSTRLRSDGLHMLACSGPIDLGWCIRPADCEPTRRGTLSHWKTRLERFKAAGLAPRGIWANSAELPVPSHRALASLGFEFDCRPHAGVVCRAEPVAGEATAPAWVRCGAAPLPEATDFVEWVGEHYQSGCPLILHAASDRPELARDLASLEANAARCSLLWPTSLGDFAAWWRRRRDVRIQVWRTEAGYEILAAGNEGPQLFAVELWRGHHLATIPLQHSELHVPDEGLLYLRAHKKNPAGLSLPNDSVLELVAPEAGKYQDRLKTLRGRVRQGKET